MNLWATRSLPVLRWIQAHDGVMQAFSLGEIAQDVGLTAAEVDAEMERLHCDGLVDAQVGRTLNGGNAAGWHVITPRLTGAGARALGEWPDGSGLIALVERMAESEPDEAKRFAFRELLGTMRSVGTSVVGEVLAAFLKAQMRLP